MEIRHGGGDFLEGRAHAKALGWNKHDVLEGEYGGDR